MARVILALLFLATTLALPALPPPPATSFAAGRVGGTLTDRPGMPSIGRSASAQALSATGPGRIGPAQRPIVFPDDEAPHTNRSEWWYYTGHLTTADGATYGFELTFFQAFLESGAPGYVGHFAVTDPARGTFRYAQRVAIGEQPRAEQGFDLRIETWAMRGALGEDALRADMPGHAVDLRLSATRPPVLHGGGYLQFGVAGDSYYYTRSRMYATGTLTLDGTPQPVTGLAWMDHQWGDFAVDPAQGGWDWFSAHLDDGSDLMLVALRDASGTIVGGFGSFVAPDDQVTDLRLPDFTIHADSTWTSPLTGIVYPADWRLTVPRLDLDLRVQPTLPEQELDTRLTTGVVYWEGQTRLTGSRTGAAVSGLGYTELTGYLPR